MQFIIGENSRLPSSMQYESHTRLNLLLPGYHEQFTTGGSNSAKDQAKENGSLARRTRSLRYPKNKGRPINKIKRARPILAIYSDYT